MSAGKGTGTGTLQRSPGGPDPVAVGATALLLVATGAVVTVLLLMATGADQPSTIGDPGPATTTGLPLARYLQDLLGVLVVGCAVVVALAPGSDGEALRTRARRLLGPAAGAWAAVTVGVYLLTASDLSGRPLPRVVDATVQDAFLSLPQARAQLLVLLCAALLVAASRVPATASRPGSAVVLLLATAGLLPPAFVGHSAAAQDHELAVASVSLHLVAGAMWVGGLALLAVLVLGDRRLEQRQSLPTMRSFSSLALGCVVVIGLSGVLNGSLRVEGTEQLLGSPYGLLLATKALLLLVLVGFGAWHRRHSLRALAAGAGRAVFLRLVVAELAVMVLTVSLAVVLARTPPPGV